MPEPILENRLIPVNEIFIDHDFNCRDEIKIDAELIDLARDIKLHGLMQPIIVHPYTHPERPQVKYRVLVGHRRFSAMGLNESKEIPAMIREIKNETEAYVLNAQENLQRKDLSTKEEAAIIRKLAERGMSQDEMALELKKTRGWLQARLYLSKLPDGVQKAIVTYNIPNVEIKKIYTHYFQFTKSGSRSDLESMNRYVQALVEGKKNPSRSVPKKKKPSEKTLRSKTDLLGMMEHLRGQDSDFDLIEPLTRTLAWAAGTLTNAEYDLYLKKFHEDNLDEYESMFDDGSEGFSS